MSVETVLRVQDLTVVLGKQKILADIDFEIEAGEYLGIVGPNGGGKSTLLKAILGLIPFKRGRIEVMGAKAGSKKACQSIGYVPQVPPENFFLPITVEEVVSTGFIKGVNGEQMDAALEVVDAKHLKNKLFSDLSGGQRQRVIIARAMVGNPSILFLDEPLSAVDAPSQKQFYELLARLNKEEKLTVIMVTHDLEMVAAATSRVLCLNKHLHASCHPEDFLISSKWAETFGEKLKPVHHLKHHA